MPSIGWDPAGHNAAPPTPPHWAFMYVSVQRVGGMFSGDPPGSQILGSSAWELPTQQTVMTVGQLHTLPSGGPILIVSRKYRGHHTLSFDYRSDAVLCSFPGFSH